MMPGGDMLVRSGSRGGNSGAALDFLQQSGQARAPGQDDQAQDSLHGSQ